MPPSIEADRRLVVEWSWISLLARRIHFVRIDLANSCQRKVEMSGLLQFRNVRFQGLRQG